MFGLMVQIGLAVHVCFGVHVGLVVLMLMIAFMTIRASKIQQRRRDNEG